MVVTGADIPGGFERAVEGEVIMAGSRRTSAHRLSVRCHGVSGSDGRHA